MPAIEVNPAKDMTRALAIEARRLGMSSQMVSSHRRPHNRKTGCIPYYIAAAMPQEEGRRFGKRCSPGGARCVPLAAGGRGIPIPWLAEFSRPRQDLRHLRGES